MGFGDWAIGIFMRFESNGAITMARLASSTRAANEQLLRQQGLIDANAAAMARYTRRIEEIRLAQLRNTTMMAGGFALAGSASIAYSIAQAADLQRALTTVQIATGANGTQMGRIRQLAYDVSNITAQSVVQSAQIIGVMASSGINQIKQLNPDFVKTVAQFADVQFLKSGGQVSFEDATRQGIQLAHLYQAYTPQAIKPILDTVTKLSFMMPDNLNRYLTQAGYYTPLFRRMGVPEDQSLIVGAFLDRMGLGRGKGGTALQDFVIQSMNALEQTKHAQTGHLQALQRLGIVDSRGQNNFYRTDRKGATTFDLFGELRQINKALADQTKGLEGSALTAKRAEFINDLLSAFKIQGARFGFLATPGGVEQLLNMIHQLGRTQNTAQAQSTYMGNFWGGFQRAKTNVQSIFAELGTPWLKNATNFFIAVADGAHRIQVALHNNKDIERDIGGIVAAVTTLAGIKFVTGMLGLAAATLRFGSAVDRVTRQILADDGLLLVGGGKGGGAAVAAAEKEGGFSRFLRGAWDFATGGFGPLIISAGTAVSFWLTKSLLLPVTSMLGKLGPFGQRLAIWMTTFAGRMTGIEGVLGGILSPLTLFGNALGILAGKLNAVVFFLQAMAPIPAGESPGWRDPHTKIGPPTWARGGHAAHVHIEHVSFVLPKDSDRGNANRILQYILGTAGAAHPGTRINITPAAYGAAAPVG
jgi:hypothetical protein